MFLCRLTLTSLVLGLALQLNPLARAQAQSEDSDESVAGAIVAADVEQKASIWTTLKNKISVGYFNFSTIPMNQANVGAARLEAYNYITFDYRFSRNRKMSLRPTFLFGTAGTTDREEYKAGDFKLSDAYVSYVEYNLFDLPGGLEFTPMMRVYGPTSTDSQERGMIARLRPELQVDKRLSTNWSVSLIFEPEYYLQSRTAYLDDRGRVYGNRNYGYESKLQLERRLNRTFSLSTSAGHLQMWNHASPENHVEGRDKNDEVFRQESMRLEAGASMALKGLFMVAGVSQKRELARPRTGFRLFNEEESSYYLLTSMRF